MSGRALTLAVVLVTACRKEAHHDAVERAAVWLAAFPEDQLRFDAAIALHAALEHRDEPALRRAFERARAVADRDTDNPMRRLYEPDFRAAPTPWAIPPPGERINVNRPVTEALHCREHGLRPEALDYVTGAMRDDGGYQTTHALWALVIARDQGCLEPARFTALARPLVDELRAAQPAAPEPAALEVDLFGERLLMLLLAGERGATVEEWAARLRAAQGRDGGFGTLADGEDPYHRYHATAIAVWALTELESAR